MEQFSLDIDAVDNNTPSGDSQPLAARMRPRSIDEFVGQKHILENGKLLRRAIDSDRFTSIILSGPPGTGKTSLSELIAQSTRSAFVRLSGVISTVADIRKEILKAVQRKKINGQKTVVFIDEIHRFNKAQQDVLLPDVENGNIRLIGATTHNPHFYVIGPLLSRSLLFQLEPLSEEDIKAIIRRAVTDKRGFGEQKVNFSEEALAFLASICEGDARKSLNAAEIAVMTTPPGENGIINIDLAAAEASIQKKAIVYGDDGHYDTASAFIKSMRGSDPDAAVYWLAKMLHAGEDIRFIARRITIFASEDIGNADPRALTLAVSAMQAIEMIGMPEARIILSHAVTYCATAPKSNSSCVAIDAALSDIKSGRVVPVPKHLRDSHYSGAKQMGYGKDYKYPHNYEGNFTVQDYLGVGKKYYEPSENGYESKIKERIEYWNKCRNAEGKNAAGTE
ncbi:MAG: AAA family ATPase [Lentisphaerae bacterium GWF2_44_16]|nr:MAG: AAA family ATPase [Lentisphaerae bacterium GWF2_44_16]